MTLVLCDKCKTVIKDGKVVELNYKDNEKKWFVANDNGELIGHDMGEAKAKALAEEMQEKEPDAGWEAMNGDDE